MDQKLHQDKKKVQGYKYLLKRDFWKIHNLSGNFKKKKVLILCSLLLILLLSIEFHVTVFRKHEQKQLKYNKFNKTKEMLRQLFKRCCPLKLIQMYKLLASIKQYFYLLQICHLIYIFRFLIIFDLFIFVNCCVLRNKSST